MRVKKGDIWEFDNPGGYPIERYCLVLILDAERQGKDPEDDRFINMALSDGETCRIGVVQSTHLTIHTNEYGHLWKKVC